MQRGKSVKIKEVIESFCKLLSALGVEFVPNTDTFRRAKYNKGDAVDDLWKLLYSLLSRTVLWECRSQNGQEQDVGAQAWLVSGVLWQLGYGAPWLGRTLSGASLGQEVGSRDLLLALGWVISSGGLLETLLAEQALGVETLTAPPGVPDCRPGVELPLVAGQGVGCGGSGLAGRGLGGSGWEGVLRRAQWEQGRLQRLWRGLYATLEERARLLHQVLSSTTYQSGTHSATDRPGHCKELECLRADIGVLQIYLDWKQMEPLFWSWMDSVIDTEPAKPSPPSHRGAVAMALKNAVVKGARCQGDSGIRGAAELGEMLQLLQVRLKAWRSQLTDHASTSGDMISSSEKAKIQEGVELRLRHLTEAYIHGPTYRSYRLRPPEDPSHRPHRPTELITSQAGHPIEAQASRVIKELREVEAGLRQEVARWRRSQREELQELFTELEGVVLIPPPKRGVSS